MAANSKTTAKKARGKPFEPGKSGNPSGRPKVPQEFKDLAKRYSIPALKRVIEIMESSESDSKDKLRAADIIMDRAWGKPTQDLTLGNPDGGKPFEVKITVVE